MASPVGSRVMVVELDTGHGDLVNDAAAQAAIVPRLTSCTVRRTANRRLVGGVECILGRPPRCRPAKTTRCYVSSLGNDTNHG